MENIKSKIEIDRFDDIKILRFKVPYFDKLSLKQKRLVYHLAEAALWGRDIFTIQNFKYNLIVRNVLEQIYLSDKIDKSNDEFKALEIYLKKIWFASGIHHHYSGEKFVAHFSKNYFITQSNIVGIATNDIDICVDVIFSDKYMQRCCQSNDMDLLVNSSSNYYENITQKEAEEFYSEMSKKGDAERPISYGLNSRLVKENGQVKELVYKIGGEFSLLIEKIVEHLEKAIDFTENSNQKDVIQKLIKYYNSGDLKDFDIYNIAWLKDINSEIDFINGFIEVYGDPLGYKASWEANVSIKDKDATHLTEIISSNAQWFEDNSPIDKKYKKSEVKGVTAKVITVAVVGGDCYPATPLGINLPNSDWIRKEHGSKSVTIKNISDAYSEDSLSNGVLQEFYFREEDINLSRKYGNISSNLHTDLHECLGHGSGQLAEGVKGDELRNYGSPIEEARADLFALYYMGDEKLVKLGIMPSIEVMKAAYNSYIFNGLMGQLARIEKGKDIMQAHMRNRQMVAKWCFEKGKNKNIVSITKKEDKSYIIINDYNGLRNLFAELLKEIQRIKSEGDYDAACKLIENYGVKVDQNLHTEVLERYNRLNIAPYSGFVNPIYKEILDNNGRVVDIEIEYTDNYTEQMLEYSSSYSL